MTPTYPEHQASRGCNPLPDEQARLMDAIPPVKRAPNPDLFQVSPLQRVFGLKSKLNHLHLKL